MPEDFSPKSSIGAIKENPFIKVKNIPNKNGEIQQSVSFNQDSARKNHNFEGTTGSQDLAASDRLNLQFSLNPSTANDGFLLKFSEGSKMLPVSDHIEALSKPRPPFHSRDFFMNKDFRGLFLADHQEAIGDKAFECVDELNKTVLTKFKGLPGFNDALQKRKEISTFYKEDLIPRIKAEKALRVKTSQGGMIVPDH